jgi:hypothetical protein
VLGGDSGPDNGKEKELGVMAGMEWFGAPQLGDSIVVMAADMEGNHKTNAKLVARALEEKHIRMFGLALGRQFFSAHSEQRWPGAGRNER